MATKNIDINITEHVDKKLFQVRFIRKGVKGGKPYSKTFSYKNKKDRQKALDRAYEYRRSQWVLHGRRQQKIPVLGEARKKANATGDTGITKSLFYSKATDKYYLRYQVCWVDHHKAKIKTFNVGSVKYLGRDSEGNHIYEIDPIKELHAFLTAKRFRWEYETSLAKKDVFHPEKFSGWKKKELYLENYQARSI